MISIPQQVGGAGDTDWIRFGRRRKAMDQKRQTIMLWIAGLGAAVGVSAFAAAVIALLLGHNGGSG
jgi:hypothetical protein